MTHINIALSEENIKFQAENAQLRAEVERLTGGLFERDGDWWLRENGKEYRLLDLAPTLEAEALKDEKHVAWRRIYWAGHAGGKADAAAKNERLQREIDALYDLLKGMKLNLGRILENRTCSGS